MPCQSNKEDLEDARLVSETFGVKLLEVDLTDTYEKLENEIKSVLKENLKKESKINMKPRLRMTTLYSIAQNYNYLVIVQRNFLLRRKLIRQ